MNLSEHFNAAEITAAKNKLLACTQKADAHHPMGPSSLYRAERCNASVLAGIICGRDTESRDATDGTRRHALFAALVGGLVKPDSIEDADDRRHVEFAAAIIETIKADIRRDAKGEPFVVWSEVPLCGSAIFGTADFLAICGKTGYLLDWKTGYAGGNELATLTQLQAYSAMAAVQRQLTECKYAAALTDSWEIACVGSMTFDGAVVHLARLAALREQCLRDDAKFGETGDHCAYCPVKKAVRCPVVAAEAMDAADTIHPDAVALCGPCDVVDVANADDWLCKLAKLRELIDPVEALARSVIIGNGGSDSFAVVNVKGRKSTDYKGLIKAASVPPEMVEQFTKTGEPSVQLRRK